MNVQSTSETFLGLALSMCIVPLIIIFGVAILIKIAESLGMK